MTSKLFRVALLFGAFGCAASDGYSKAPATFSGTITAVSDGDTFTVKSCNGRTCRLVKVRLHGVDCPEVKHYRNEVDQPGGREALDYVVKTYLGKGVIVSPISTSYGRVVARVDAGGTDVARDLIVHGFAMLDPRYSKDKELIAAQDKASCDDLGIWSGDENPIPPWEWRRNNKAKIVQLRKK